MGPVYPWTQVISMHGSASIRAEGRRLWNARLQDLIFTDTLYIPGPGSSVCMGGPLSEQRDDGCGMPDCRISSLRTPCISLGPGHQYAWEGLYQSRGTTAVECQIAGSHLYGHPVYPWARVISMHGRASIRAEGRRLWNARLQDLIFTDTL